MTTETMNKLARAGVSFSSDVNPDQIADTAVIHPGCRISGAETSIGPECVLGQEAPVTVENCQLGRKVKLKGGYFSGAVFFDKSSMGSGAHVRAGTILEEEASGAHTVGLKQTVLLPFVTTGSLINFCDALMGGGSSRNDHSEVGSSYIHFNYTPHQDKATASLIGDVPQGVFLDQPAIFLGGQGGLVGPARIDFGSVIAAGGICRQDICRPGKLLIPPTPKSGEREYAIGVYRNIDRTVANCMIYLGNIAALKSWYIHVRKKFTRDPFDLAVLEGGISNLNLITEERIKRLGQVAGKMDYSYGFLAKNSGKADEIKVQKKFKKQWASMKSAIEEVRLDSPPEFLTNLNPENTYIQTIQSLPAEQKEAGTEWLQEIVGSYEKIWSQA
jgi:UDP-N-acetylglucosamine/UDP-N-acetylgalactosamine diphosphorylase